MKKRILIIEDDAKSRFALEAVLQERGFDVVAASTAEQAAQLNGFPYAAAVIDIRLPEKPGHVYAQELRDKHPEMRIIFVTAYHGDGDLRINIPGSVVMIKPIEMDVLCKLL